jgi:hypothetical protein
MIGIKIWQSKRSHIIDLKRLLIEALILSRMMFFMDLVLQKLYFIQLPNQLNHCGKEFRKIPHIQELKTKLQSRFPEWGLKKA